MLRRILTAVLAAMAAMFLFAGLASAGGTGGGTARFVATHVRVAPGGCSNVLSWSSNPRPELVNVYGTMAVETDGYIDTYAAQEAVGNATTLVSVKPYQLGSVVLLTAVFAKGDTHLWASYSIFHGNTCTVPKAGVIRQLPDGRHLVMVVVPSGWHLNSFDVQAYNPALPPAVPLG